jgi:hypothetical protein
MLLWRRVKALALAGGGRLLWLAIAVLLLSALLGPALREAIRRGLTELLRSLGFEEVAVEFQR